MSGLLRRLAAGRRRIATQLYLAIGGAVALTMGASLVGWIAFNRVGEAQDRVNLGSVPEMATAFAVAQQGNALAAATPKLTTAATAAAFAQVAAEVAAERDAFAAQLETLISRGGDAGDLRRIRDHGTALTGNLGALVASVETGFVLAASSAALRAEVAAAQHEVSGILVSGIDDQLFYAMTGYHTLGQPPAPRTEQFSEREFTRYRHLTELQEYATTGTELLARAFTLADAALLEPLQERFEATSVKIDRTLVALGALPLRSRVAPAFARLRELGLGDPGGFGLRRQELQLAAQQQELLARNLAIASDLVAEAERLVSAAEARAREATVASTRAIVTGRGLLLVLNVISIAGAVIIAWLFVGRLLLRRLRALSERMRGMADGNLEGQVAIGGHDEVAEMAAALEVFRRHALEVQRLNLVEKLAGELRGKNAELEGVLADLRRAQDQIVMREKLAALGELTAGVAHEIKNPLNFVTNFAEVSAELLEELDETIAEGGGALNQEQRALIREIAGDLTGNLQRIREHGERANRIVRDMLSMGRGVTQRQPTDLNKLLADRAQLAFHSARAANPDFQLTIEEDYDPHVGTPEVAAQNLGRVFLNLVTNAGYATAEKRRADAGTGYQPLLRLTTRRTEQSLEIRIRDNGTGIPPEIAGKIFDPFFTTKPTDQGTGLGLALSNDIVREHGGALRAESEPGAFTEMIVELPATPSRAATGSVDRVDGAGR